MQQFSVRELLRLSWQDYKKNWKILLGVFFLTISITQLPGLLIRFLPEELWFLSVLLGIFSWLFSLIIQMGNVRINLNIIDGKVVQVPDLFFAFKNLKLVLNYIVTFLLMILLILVFVFVGGLLFGLLGFSLSFLKIEWLTTFSFLILPSLAALIFLALISLRLMFWVYLLIDKDFWAAEGIWKAWKITKGKTLKLLLLALVLIFLNVGGMLLIFIGLAVTIPVSSLIVARVYRAMESNRNASVTPPIDTTV